MNRRKFTQTAGIAAAGLAAQAITAQTASAASYGKPKFYKSLAAGAIGVTGNQKELIDYASQFGFDGVAVSLGELEKMSATERKETVDYMKSKNVRWGHCGLPVQFRAGEDEFQTGIKQLPKQAEIIHEVGCTRVSTWLSPSHDELTYMQNFEQHRKRLKKAAKILKDNELRIGLEYVGPKTSWTAKRFSFVHSQPEMIDLIDAIGEDNVGILLDSWHWYTSFGTVEELKKVTYDLAVDVQVNDAPLGLKIDEQKDLERMLPCTTNVIDLKNFMQFLVDIGYDGPISCEPFNKKLNEMENEAALKESVDSLNRLFALVGA